MGMRATIGFIGNDKIMKLTTVQWSTVLDVNLGIITHNALNESSSEAEALQNVKSIIREVTDTYDHISSFETARHVSPTEKHLRFLYDACAVRGQEREGFHSRGRVSSMKYVSDMKKKAYNFHLEGGSIGLLINEPEFDKNGKVDMFYINDETDEIQVSKISLLALANYYKDGTAKKPLKKFAFRTH